MDLEELGSEIIRRLKLVTMPGMPWNREMALAIRNQIVAESNLEERRRRDFQDQTLAQQRLDYWERHAEREARRQEDENSEERRQAKKALAEERRQLREAAAKERAAAAKEKREQWEAGRADRETRQAAEKQEAERYARYAARSKELAEVPQQSIERFAKWVYRTMLFGAPAERLFLRRIQAVDADDYMAVVRRQAGIYPNDVIPQNHWYGGRRHFSGPLYEQCVRAYEDAMSEIPEPV